MKGFKYNHKCVVFSYMLDIVLAVSTNNKSKYQNIELQIFKGIVDVLGINKNIAKLYALVMSTPLYVLFACQTKVCSSIANV